MSRMTKTTPTIPAATSKPGKNTLCPSDLRERVLLSLDLLDEILGGESLPADAYSTGEPLDGLLLTLLSQNTNDQNRDRAYESLREAFPTWKAVAAAPVSAIAKSIRSAGLGETKAARMKDILLIIRADFGSYSLKAMKRWDPAKARAYLEALPGIGNKTAACVLVFDLNMSAFPVDTHVGRIARRLGWVPGNWPPEKIQAFLEETVPPGRCRGGHLNMIEHGRRVCLARKPKCSACPLQNVCEFHMRELGAVNNG